MLRSYEAILDHNHLRWQGELPDVREARVIVTILEPSPRVPTPRRQPAPGIAGKGSTLGDLVEPIVATQDWECLK